MAAEPQEQYVVDASGGKRAVILSLKRYQELMEDLHDLAMVAERRNEPSIGLNEMKRRLKKDGLLVRSPSSRRLRRTCARCRYLS